MGLRLPVETSPRCWSSLARSLRYSYDSSSARPSLCKGLRLGAGLHCALVSGCALISVLRCRPRLLAGLALVWVSASGVCFACARSLLARGLCLRAVFVVRGSPHLAALVVHGL